MSARQQARDALQQDVLWQPKNAYRTVPYRTVPAPYRTVPAYLGTVRPSYRTVPVRKILGRTVPDRTVPYRDEA